MVWAKNRTGVAAGYQMHNGTAPRKSAAGKQPSLDITSLYAGM